MGWKTSKLGDVCDMIKRGVGPKYIDEGGICVVNQKCVRGHAVSYDFARRHDLESKKVNQERYIKVGDVLVNSTGTGTLGRVAQVRVAPSEPTTVDTHVTIVRPEPGLFFDAFFGYMLIKIEEEITSAGEGASGQTELARTKLENEFFVSYSESIPEQKRIVAILDQAFADIDKARANAEQNLKNARELFESYLQQVFSQRGEGWVERTLKDVSVEFGRGKSKHRPRNDESLYGGDYPFIQTGDVRNCEHVVTKFSKTYNEKGLAQSKLWPKGTICITIAANIAETGILSFEGCFPDSVIGVVVNPKLTTVQYVEYLLQSFKAVLQAKGQGSAQDNINMGTFESMLFPFPTVEKQKEIVNRLGVLMASVQKLEKVYSDKLTALDELKKSILQKAFSGELTIEHQTSSPEYSANVMADAYFQHAANRRDKTFGHVKAQKLLHLTESIAGIELGRNPIKDAAGPNDFAHMEKAEDWAKQQQFFEFKLRPTGGYDFIKLDRFEELMLAANKAIEPNREALSEIVHLLIPMNKIDGEVFATVHAAWNNLILNGDDITNEAIVWEARENWHPDKMKIPRDVFFSMLQLIKDKNLIPDGTAKRVIGTDRLL